MNCNDRFEPPEKDRVSFLISISDIYNWFKSSRKKKAIDNIKRYEQTILEEQEQNGEEGEEKRQ
jgi:hypothetical protein